MYGISKENLNILTLELLMRYFYHFLQVKKVSETLGTKLNIVDNKIDAKAAELLAIIQVSLRLNLELFTCSCFRNLF